MASAGAGGLGSLQTSSSSGGLGGRKISFQQPTSGYNASGDLSTTTPRLVSSLPQPLPILSVMVFLLRSS